MKWVEPLTALPTQSPTSWLDYSVPRRFFGVPPSLFSVPPSVVRFQQPKVYSILSITSPVGPASQDSCPASPVSPASQDVCRSSPPAQPGFLSSPVCLILSCHPATKDFQSALAFQPSRSSQPGFLSCQPSQSSQPGFLSVQPASPARIHVKPSRSSLVVFEVRNAIGSSGLERIGF